MNRARKALVPLDPAIARDVEAGLRASPRTLPPYLFYDERGSALFEAITRLPEYYLTRCEQEIFGARAAELAQRAGAVDWVIELGAGTAAKTRLLLDALLARARPLTYVASTSPRARWRPRGGSSRSPGSPSARSSGATRPPWKRRRGCGAASWPSSSAPPSATAIPPRRSRCWGGCGVRSRPATGCYWVPTCARTRRSCCRRTMTRPA